MGRMPVACGENWQALIVKKADISVDDGNDGIGVRNAKRSTREKIVLEIDKDQSGLAVGLRNTGAVGLGLLR